jgi:hypothetical protein
VISGDAPGLTRIYLPSEATLNFTFDEEMQSAGGDFTIRAPEDRFAGFVLQQERDDLPGAAYLVGAWRYPADLRAGAFASQESAQVNLGEALAAGWYRLYLLTEPGVTAEVELRLGGLEGRTELVPEQASTTKISRLTPMPTPLDPGTHYVARGAEVIAPSVFPSVSPTGMRIMGMAQKGAFPGASHIKLCDYYGEVRHELVPAVPVACVPFGSMDSSLVSGNGGAFVAQGPGAFVRWGMISEIGEEPGLHTLTANGQFVGEPDSVATIGVWISLD